MKNNIIRKFESFNAKNTLLRFDRVLYVDLQSSGGTYKQFPNFVLTKKCCINVNNKRTNRFRCNKQEHMRCFEYALESILNPALNHSNRPSRYDITKYEVVNMEYSVELTPDNIKKYEEFLNISINVYTVYNNTRIDFHILSEKIGKTEKHVNILEYD